MIPYRQRLFQKFSAAYKSAMSLLFSILVIVPAFTFAFLSGAFSATLQSQAASLPLGERIVGNGGKK
jgi:hypothetical protein